MKLKEAMSCSLVLSILGNVGNYSPQFTVTRVPLLLIWPCGLNVVPVKTLAGRREISPFPFPRECQ